MIKPKLSIIILNFNTAALLDQCIKSILKFTSNVTFEILVVDNASTEADSIKLLKTVSDGNKVKVIKNKKNLGFAKGNNVGIKASLGEYILLLNSDTFFTENFLSKFISWMDKNPKIGVASCQLQNEDNSIQGTGGYFPTLFKVLSWMLFLDDIPFIDKMIKPFHPWHSRSIYKGENNYENKKEFDWLTGAFMMIRKKVIEEIGLLDEDYFMYVEDLDFCFRAKQKGWKIVYNPAWNIVHLGGKSSKTDFPIISEFKALKLFYKKYYPSWQSMFLAISFKIGCLLRIIVFGLINQSTAKIYEKAFYQI